MDATPTLLAKFTETIFISVQKGCERDLAELKTSHPVAHQTTRAIPKII